jgi:hypothetical protein
MVADFVPTRGTAHVLTIGERLEYISPIECFTWNIMTTRFRSYSFEVDHLKRSLELALKKGNVDLGALLRDQIVRTHTDGMASGDFKQFWRVWNHVARNVQPRDLMLPEGGKQRDLWSESEVVEGEIIVDEPAKPATGLALVANVPRGT